MDAHPLLQMVQQATSDPARHQQAADIVARVQPLLDEAFRCEEATRARELLPLALRTMYIEVQPLLGMELVRPTWLEQQHRALHTKARQLFGAAQHIVQPLGHEPLTPPARSGMIFPR